MKILHIADELNQGDGVTNQLYILSAGIIKRKNTEVIICCGGGDGIEKFRAKNIEVVVNKNLAHRNRSLKNYTAAILKINSFIRKKAIDIVHSHSHYAANIANRGRRLTEVRTVQTIHGLFPGTGRLKHYIADNYVAVSRHVFDHLKKNNGLNNVSLIHNGVNINKNFKKSKSSELKFILAARFEKGKGIDTFIKSVSMLPENIKSECRFMIAGRGSLGKMLKEKNEKLKAGIEFKGLITDISRTFEESDVLVITSEKEGFPMTMLEAGSKKNLIITSSFEGSDELIDDGSDGLIYKTGKENDLKEKIIFAYCNRKFIADASGKFFEKVQRKFSSDEMVRKYIELYEKILGT